MQASQRFIGVSAALFFGSAALTVAWCNSMSALHDMPMCSTRAVSIEALPASAATFLVMWLTMMMAMMLPSLMPVLWRYRQTVVATERLDALIALVGLGYFFVWTVFGVFVFAVESTVSTRTVPMVTGVIVFIAGALQFTGWKARHLACCSGLRTCCQSVPAAARSAWQYGLRLGVHCVYCCLGLTVVLLAVGMMDLRAMALVTAAISIERLAPDGLRAARFIGAVLVATGAFLIARAMI